MNLEKAYKLAPGVIVEPDQFGALLHIPQKRRPYFIFNPKLAEFVRDLDGRQILGQALDQFVTRQRLSARDRSHFVKALSKLEALKLLQGQ
jgi:hypothetical protein